jgi:uncharacterized small protein (DUF1192 family)
MAFPEDDRPKKPEGIRPGENLADLSVDELKARIAVYNEEIERLAREIAAKEKHRLAADSVFRR